MLDFSWSTSLTLPSNRTISLRYPVLEDAEMLMNFINPIIAEKAHILLNEPQILEGEKKYLHECLQKMLKDQMIKIAAYFENRIIGVVDIRRASHKENHVGTLGISISKDFRREGLGSLLIQEVLSQAKEKFGLLQVILTCSELNVPAQKLYKKLGFIEYGRLPDAIQYSGGFVDQVLMYKKL